MFPGIGGYVNRIPSAGFLGAVSPVMDGGLGCTRILQKDYRQFKETLNGEGTPPLRAHGIFDMREKGRHWKGMAWLFGNSRHAMSEKRPSETGDCHGDGGHANKVWRDYLCARSTERGKSVD